MVNGQVVTGIEQAGASLGGSYLTQELGEEGEEDTEALHLRVTAAWCAWNKYQNLRGWLGKVVQRVARRQREIGY